MTVRSEIAPIVTDCPDCRTGIVYRNYGGPEAEEVECPTCRGTRTVVAFPPAQDESKEQAR